MIDKHRLIRPDYNLADIFVGKKVNSSFGVTVGREKVLMIDPTYLADVYNADDADSAFVREQGLFVEGFGGDVSGPVILTDSLLLMPLSLHYSQGGEPPAPNEEWIKASSLGCDSGSFVFLRMTPEIPPSTSRTAQEEVTKGNGVFLKMTPGHWELYFEQFDAPRDNMRRLYRNIVLLRA